MSRYPERIFDPNRPVIARRFFVAAGRHYQPGDAFDWTHLAVAQRRVRQLFDNGKLMHPDEPAMPALAPKPVPAKTIEEEVEDEDIHHAAVTAAAPADEPSAAAKYVAASDGLDDLNMKELRAIAEEEGAPFRVSRDDQRVAIRENRRASARG
jgi:hypothetical protein